jgi:hypothetical protein
MKNSLLSSVAALALLFGAGQVLAQGTKGEAPPQKSESAAPSKAESTAPSPKAESSSPSGAPKASTAETAPPSKSGATAQDKGQPKGSKAANEMKSDSKQPSTAQTNPPGAAKDSKAAGTDSKAGATTGNAATSATAAPPAEKRTEIVSAIRQQKVEEVTNVNFNISVGATIPASVRFHPLPPRIVEIYPEWRGYEFILVHGRYIIVRPQTREIVYIIES